MNDEIHKPIPIALRLTGGLVGGAILGVVVSVFLGLLFWAVVLVLGLLNLVPLNPSGANILWEALGSLILVVSIGGLVGAVGGVWQALARD